MRVLRVVALVLWQLPIAIPVWLFYLLPIWALGWIDLYSARRGPWLTPVAGFFANGNGPGWWFRAWRGWYGHALPCAMVIDSPRDPTDGVYRHEARHCRQWAILGPLFPVVYLALLAVYGYKRHPLERDANRAERV